MSDNPVHTNWIESIHDLSALAFAPGDIPDSARLVGAIARGLLYLASDHASNWELNEVIDGGGVHYWEMNEGNLDVYSTNSVSFTLGRDIVSKATFEDCGEEINSSLAIGNVNPETRTATEYPGALLMPTEEGVMVLAKSLEPISWVNVLHATIAADNTFTIVESH